MTRPAWTASDELMPPVGTLAFHTRAPVSALRAKTQPRFEAANRRPSATTGVPLKSPSPPAVLVENVHAGIRVAAWTVPMVVSCGCDRVFDWSWPYERHSPPDTPVVGPHVAAVDV